MNKPMSEDEKLLFYRLMLERSVALIHMARLLMEHVPVRPDQKKTVDLWREDAAAWFKELEVAPGILSVL